MGSLEPLLDLLPSLVPALAVAALVAVGLRLAHWLLLRRRLEIGGEERAPRQLLVLALTALGVVLVVLALPVGESTRSSLLGLLGLVLTAVIGLSSTTFVSNAMAGLMLRSLRNFRPGDFIRVGDEFGRVTERGLFHTEIQTEDHDLTTLPNLYLATRPITVTRSSGTIVSATVSLGYDVDRSRVERLLLEAAAAAELQDPFVHVLDLGDFSVSYRVAGFLAEVKRLLSVRSDLREQMLDVLHRDGVEIVSPAFMNQRPLRDGQRFIPRSDGQRHPSSAEAAEPEARIFDKAEEAQRLEQLRAERQALAAEIQQLDKELASTESSAGGTVERRLAALRHRAAEIDAELGQADSA